MITGYVVEMCRLGDANWQTVTSNCHSTSYIVKGLEPGSKWIFRLRAQNVHGVSCFGQESDVVEIKEQALQCSDDVCEWLLQFDVFLFEMKGLCDLFSNIFVLCRSRGY